MNSTLFLKHFTHNRVDPKCVTSNTHGEIKTEEIPTQERGSQGDDSTIIKQYFSLYQYGYNNISSTGCDSKYNKKNNSRTYTFFSFRGGWTTACVKDWGTWLLSREILIMEWTMGLTRPVTYCLVRIMSTEQVWSSGEVMGLTEFKTILFSEEMLFADRSILALMWRTLSLKKFRKSSHLETDAFKQEKGADEVTE